MKQNACEAIISECLVRIGVSLSMRRRVTGGAYHVQQYEH